MPGITISASYGAGGSVVAPLVAERLGLPLLDRNISSSVAARLNVSVLEAERGSSGRSFFERLLAAMSPLATDGVGAAAELDPEQLALLNDEAAGFREASERIMRAALQSGAVVLGRAGAAAFYTSPDVLRVRLFGLASARQARAVQVENIDPDTAAKRLSEVDSARDQYVRRLYRVSVDDPKLYQLQLDSTALPLPACVELIASAYRAFIA